MDDDISTAPEHDAATAAQVTVSAAVATVADCVSAGLTLPGGTDPMGHHVGSDDRARAAHARQVALGAGPTKDAVTSGDSVYCGDLASDARWPAWSADMQAAGFRAVVVLPLSAGRVTLGHLALYAEVPQAFPIHDTLRTLSFVEHAAVTLNAAGGIDRRDRTLERLIIVGQAQGMIMQRFGVTPARAFAVLERASHWRGLTPQRLAEAVVAVGVDEALAHDARFV